VPDVRVGLGFDVHPTEVGRPLKLAGVEFDDAPGLAGHSDADVVCHAVADAVLGAAGLGDIGRHFPDSDPLVVGMAGLDLLSRVVSMLDAPGLRPSSCDLTVIAGRPSMAPRVEEMRSNLAAVLGVALDRVSIKATRPEGLGLAGDGVGCIAVAVLGGR
jgi:2-C-methyl-D-erythritol 2,4-cyclodiphosphate synthase